MSAASPQHPEANYDRANWEIDQSKARCRDWFKRDIALFKSTRPGSFRFPKRSEDCAFTLNVTDANDFWWEIRHLLQNG
jgi:hypothetical protein